MLFYMCVMIIIFDKNFFLQRCVYNLFYVYGTTYVHFFFSFMTIKENGSTWYVYNCGIMLIYSKVHIHNLQRYLHKIFSCIRASNGVVCLLLFTIHINELCLKDRCIWSVTRKDEVVPDANNSVSFVQYNESPGKNPLTVQVRVRFFPSTPCIIPCLLASFIMMSTNIFCLVQSR